MSTHRDEQIEELKVERGLDDEMVRAAVDDFWAAFRSDPKMRDSAQSRGVNVALLDNVTENPFGVERTGAAYDVLTTIVISVVGGMAKDALVALWKVAVWPYLESKFGGKLEKVKDAPKG